MQGWTWVGKKGPVLVQTGTWSKGPLREPAKASRDPALVDLPYVGRQGPVKNLAGIDGPLYWLAVWGFGM